MKVSLQYDILNIEINVGGNFYGKINLIFNAICNIERIVRQYSF